MREYLFTPGPVMISKKIRKIGAQPLSYFRNNEFSAIINKCRDILLKISGAPNGSEVIFLTSSGSGVMEAAIINSCDNSGFATIINGGGFSQRFIEIFKCHDLPYKSLNLARNEQVNFDLINKSSFALVLNAHETSIGRLYDVQKFGKFCNENNILFIVDAISCFITDKINMQEQNIDILITTSNKGLALPPGLSIVILSPKAIKNLKNSRTLYFDFKRYLNDMSRFQTPFTPTISIFYQLFARLGEIEKKGVEKYQKNARNLAHIFRKGIANLPLEFYSNDMPNAMSAVIPTDSKKASQIISYFKQNYNIILTPSGGDLSEKLIRISHMGDMKKSDIDYLVKCFQQFYKGKK